MRTTSLLKWLQRLLNVTALSGLFYLYCWQVFANYSRLAPVLAWGSLIGGLLLCILLHELGHAAASLIVRWRIVIFAMWPWAFHVVNREFVWSIRKYGWAGVGGYILSVPCDEESATWRRHCAFVAGGPIASFVLGIFMIGGALAALRPTETQAASRWLWILGLQSIYVGLVSLLPTEHGMNPSDGQKLLQLCRVKPLYRDPATALLMIHKLVANKIRLADCPEWMLHLVRREAGASPVVRRQLDALEIGILLDKGVVEPEPVRTRLDDFAARHGRDEWLASCDAYFTAVYEVNGTRARALLWQGKTTDALTPLRLAAEAAVAAREGMREIACIRLAEMDAALRRTSPFSDLTFRDVRCRIEALLG